VTDVTSMTPVAAARAAQRAGRWRAPTVWLRLSLLAALGLVPLVSSFQLMDLALKIAIFAALVASYDILIGYTGIVSFGHAMFFGFGAYGVALAVARFGAPTWGDLALGAVAAVVVSAVVSVAIGAFSLRVKAIFFAMITLAFAEFAVILAVQLGPLTGGEDGLSPQFPGLLGERLGVYYVVVVVVALLFTAMSRFVSSPLGRVLQAIRDNEVRAEALGVRTFAYQSAASCFASVVATVLGACYALWVGYVNPESTLGIHIMLDILLMVIIGGIGTLWGGIIGAAFLLTAQAFLPNLRGLGAALLPGSALAVRLTDRWPLYFGILFILVVFFFPRGVVGSLRETLGRRR